MGAHDRPGRARAGDADSRAPRRGERDDRARNGVQRADRAGDAEQRDRRGYRSPRGGGHNARLRRHGRSAARTRHGNLVSPLFGIAPITGLRRPAKRLRRRSFELHDSGGGDNENGLRLRPGRRARRRRGDGEFLADRQSACAEAASSRPGTRGSRPARPPRFAAACASARSPGLSCACRRRAGLPRATRRACSCQSSPSRVWGERRLDGSSRGGEVARLEEDGAARRVRRHGQSRLADDLRRRGADLDREFGGYDIAADEVIEATGKANDGLESVATGKPAPPCPGSP